MFFTRHVTLFCRYSSTDMLHCSAGTVPLTYYTVLQIQCKCNENPSSKENEEIFNYLNNTDFFFILT